MFGRNLAEDAVQNGKVILTVGTDLGDKNINTLLKPESQKLKSVRFLLAIARSDNAQCVTAAQWHLAS
jgi:hypothetical protein